MDYNPQILCWNVRGLNNPAKRKVVREFFASLRVNVVCLQETKLDTVDQFLVLQCIGPSFDSFSYLPAVETRGGILLAWDCSCLTVDSIQIDTNFLTGKVRKLDGNEWWISVVYAPPGR